MKSDVLAETVKRSAVLPRTNTLEKRMNALQPRLIKALPYIGLGLFFLVVFVAYSGRRSIWDDEGVSINLAFSSWKVWRSYIWGTEVNMALYYLILRVWLWFTTTIGIHAIEPVVRLPSAIFAMTSVIMVFATGRKYLHPLAGWIAAILFGFSQTTLYYAEEARSYTLYTCAVIFGYYFLFAALQQGTENRRKTILLWSGFAIAMGISINAHLVGVTFVAAQIILYVALIILPSNWQQEARKQILWMTGSLIGVFIIALPILIDAKIHGGNNSFIPIPTKQDLLFMYKTLALGYDQISTNIMYLVIALGMLAVLVLGILALRYTRIPLEQMPRFLEHAPRLSGITISLISWFTLPPIIAFVLSHPPFNQHLFLYRYQMAAFVAAFLGVGLIIAIIPWNSLRVALCLLLLLLAVGSWKEYNDVVVDFGYSPYVAYVGTQHTLNWVESRYRPGDGILCVTGTLSCADIVHYYLNYAWPDRPARFEATSPGGYAGYPLGPFNPIDLQSIANFAGRHSRMFVITDTDDFAYVPPGQMTLRQGFISQHYKLLGEFHTSTVYVQLYQTQP